MDYPVSRIGRDEYFMSIAELVARRSTCKRRQVGCVMVNARGHIVATGYNGVPSGFPHCIDHAPCLGANLPSGQGLDQCFAVHAEQNAMLQCADVFAIDTCYTTASPCIQCIKLLLNTSCREIVFRVEYPHGESKILWEQGGRTWRNLTA